MKTNYALLIALTTMGFSLGTVAEVRAQAAVVEMTTTRHLGTISEFGPNEIVVRSDAAPEPVRYGFSKTTRYVDEDGVPVAVETVKTGAPVTVEYVRAGDRLVANRVIVRRTVPPNGTVIEKKTTTTTTTEKR